MYKNLSHTAGFTLVELLAGTTIFAVIMVSLIMMLNSFEAISDIKITKARMATIAKRAGEYYLSREDLPVPLATAVVAAPLGEVPLTAFHLDSKYRIDAWGRPMHYFSVRNDGENGRPGEILIDPLSTGAPAGSPTAMVVIPQADLTATPPTGKTLITGVQVNGRQVAAVLISSGPNNDFEYNIDTPPPADAYPFPFVLDNGSDDIILPIDLTPQASRIALAELKKLGEKVRAFDDRYIGKDNDGYGGYDEDGCNPIPYPGIPEPFDLTQVTLHSDGNYYIDSCNNLDIPPLLSDSFPPGTDPDISCGMPTLDKLKANFCPYPWTNCPTGYYVPEVLTVPIVLSPLPPSLPPPPPPEPTIQCSDTPRSPQPPDYARVQTPFERGNPQYDNCHWGLVGDPTLDTNELTNNQARAFIFCIYGLSPADIIDPWLNGYTWGCDTVNGCTTGFPDTPPDTDARYHKFYSAGRDRIIGSDADGDGTPDDIDGNGFIDLGDDIVAPL